jgi:large subunit ribosomal protein L10
VTVNREHKSEFIEKMREKLVESPFVALADFKGVTVAELDKVRRATEAQGIHFPVVKNTLTRRALNGTDKEGLAAHFRGNVAVLVSGEDPIAAAKLLKDLVKENDKLVVKAGFFEGTVLNEKDTLAVASLPSREELLVTLLRTLQEGPRQVLGVIRGPARDLLYLLQNYATKLEDEG